MKTLIFCDPRLGESDIGFCVASFGADVDGWICTQEQAKHIDEDVELIFIAETNDVLRELLLRGSDVFIPNYLSECIVLYADLLNNSNQQIWLDDSYISRYLVKKHFLKLGDIPESFGFAGSSSVSKQQPNNLKYSFMTDIFDINIEQISKARQACVDAIWISIATTEGMPEQFSQFARLIETIDIIDLFAGMSSIADLDAIWGQRPCLSLKHSLPAGHQITKNDLDCIQNSTGLSVNLIDQIIGKCLRYSLPAQTTLTYGMIEC